MINCNDIIELIYVDQSINTFIKKIKPIDLQQDLKQELALILLNIDCDKLTQLHNEGNLIKYVIKIIWNISTSYNVEFYKKFKKNENIEAFEYISYINNINDKSYQSSYKIAKNILDNKTSKSVNDLHEVIIFDKYVELRNCKKVAAYFGIPYLHVFNVVKKVKQELKKAINNR